MQTSKQSPTEVAIVDRHTPGPWKVVGQMHDNNRVIRAGADGQGDWVALAVDFNRYDRDAEVDANARLIASAPDLLLALKNLMRFHTDGNIGNMAWLGRLLDDARTAIERAEIRICPHGHLNGDCVDCAFPAQDDPPRPGPSPRLWADLPDGDPADEDGRRDYAASKLRRRLA